MEKESLLLCLVDSTSRWHFGGWLEGSGWTTALTDAGVASAGTADSFLKASSVTRTRRAHQVTVISLYILLQNAHNKYQEQESVKGDTILSFDDWCEKQKSVPQFYYWYTTMHAASTATTDVFESNPHIKLQKVR